MKSLLISMRVMWIDTYSLKEKDTLLEKGIRPQCKHSVT